MKTLFQLLLASLPIFVLIAPRPAEAITSKKYFCIQAKVSRMNLSTRRSLEVGQPIVQRAGNTADNHWQFLRTGDGYYYIRSKASGLFLDVQGARKTARTIVWQYRFNGTDAQKWKLIPAGDGYYYLQSKVSGLYLDVEGGSKANNATIWQFPLNRTDAQKWRFLPLGGDVSGTNLAVHASLYGPQFNMIKVFNYEFNFKPNIKITTTPRSNQKVVTGNFSHHLRFRPDDDYYFRAVFSPNGELISYQHRISRGGLSKVLPLGRDVQDALKGLSNFTDGILLLDDAIENYAHQVINSALGRGSWEKSAKQIGIIIAMAAVRNR